MRLLTWLPYATEHSTIVVRGERVRVRPHQVIVWVSLTAATQLEWDTRTPAFPAIFDPGNNFNLTIFQSQLVRWAGLQPTQLRLLGLIRLGDSKYPRREADLWLHRNIPGVTDLPAGVEPIRLALDRGIVIYRDDGKSPRHLPLLGMRAITDNRLIATLDGERREISLRSPDWQTRLLRWLWM